MPVPVSRFLADQEILRRPDAPQAPLVSVVMPTHMIKPNHGNQRAIESVLGQTLPDLELLVIDDGSIDGLNELLRSYHDTDGRVTLIRHQFDSGLPALRTDEGLMLARGRYIAYIFDDDEWEPDALSHLVETAAKSGGDALVYGTAEVDGLDSRGKPYSGTLGSEDLNYAFLRAGNKIANCAVLHPRSLLEECGLLDPHVVARRLADFDLWLRMLRQVPLIRCRQTVAKVSLRAKHSLASNVDSDYYLAVRYFTTDRDASLRGQALGRFCVDSLWFIPDPAERDNIRERYLIPFWAQHPELLSAEESKLALISAPRPRRLLVTKPDYSTAVDVHLGNFAKVLDTDVQSQGFVSETNVPAITAGYDTLVLYRTIGIQSHQAMDRSKNLGKSTIYLMDDNMLQFGIGYLADEFQYLRPGSKGYSTLQEEIEGADLLIAYSGRTVEDVAPINPRVIRLHSSIRAKYIHVAAPALGGKSTGRRLKYAILTGTARRKELELLWPTLSQFCSRWKDDIELHVWGFDPTGYGRVECPMSWRAFDHSYESYLHALTSVGFDFVICPLLDDHPTKVSKSEIKYLEITAAGSVGLFSDTPPYEVVVDGITGLKTENSPAAWQECLERSMALTDEERTRIHAQAKDDILRGRTTEMQVLDYLSAFEAAELHRVLESDTTDTGRPRVAYFFHEGLLGGATLHLLRHAELAGRYGFEPILCFPPASGPEPSTQVFAESRGWLVRTLDHRSTVHWRTASREDRVRAVDLKDWMRVNDIRMVHTVTCMVDVVMAARQLGLPVVSTLHAYYDPPASPLNRKTDPQEDMRFLVIHSSSQRYAARWREALGAQDAFCIRAPVPRQSFEAFSLRKDRAGVARPRILVVGTLQPRKGQREAIGAVRLLRDRGVDVELVLQGYDDLVPDYVAECRRLIGALDLEDRIRIAGFAHDLSSLYESADYLLCASDDESFPQAILQAMARGLRIVTTPAGGIPELVLDGWTGVVVDDCTEEALAEGIQRALRIPDPQWERMLERAHLSARMVSSEDVVAYQLLKLYNRAAMRRSATTGDRNRALAEPREPAVKVESSELRRRTKPEWAPRRATSRGLTYRIRIPQGKWIGLEVRFATYQSAIRGTMYVSIKPEKRNGSRMSVELPMESFSDNALHSIRFEGMDNDASRDYRIRFRPVFSEKGMKVAVYETHRSGGWLGKVWRRVLTKGGDLEYRLLLEQ